MRVELQFFIALMLTWIIGSGLTHAYYNRKAKAWKKLYLDDIRNPKTFGWVVVRSYDEFVKWIEKNGLPDEVSLDHDLGDADQKTGYDAAKWLVDYCLDNDKSLPQWNVHSANIVGKMNIESFLESYTRMRNRV